MKKVFIGAGEPSSDKIASDIISSMPSGIEFFGITGTEMRKCGVRSIFDIKDISFIGLDILCNIATIVNRINQTVAWIERHQPEIAIFVDAYDFYIRVAKKLKKSSCRTKIVAVVAPLAWLYSRNKVHKINKYFDKLICIFPFEPDFFAKNGHKDVHFFGNPFLQKISIKNMDRDKNLVFITIGSRDNEVARHAPLIKKVIMNIRAKYSDIKFFIATTNVTHDLIVKFFSDISGIEFSFDEGIKDVKMRTAYFAIAKSGTNNNEIAARGLPFLVYYKIGILSYIIGRFILKIKMVSMVNIVANKMIVPEIIQWSDNSKRIAKCFFDFYENEKNIDVQNREAILQINKMRGMQKESFGDLVVRNIL